MFKKTLMAIIVGTTVFTSVGVASAATLPPVQKPSLAIDLIVDGKRVTLPDTEPYIDDAGNTMVPIRFVSEKLGANVKWDNANQIVTIIHKGNTIVMPVGSKKVTVNGSEITLDTMAIKKEGRVVVPLRFVSETLNTEVKWDGAWSAVNIVSPEYQSKIDNGAVTLDRWGRELRANQNSDEWILMSDTADSFYNIGKYKITHIDGIDKSAKEYSIQFSKEQLDRIVKNIKEYYRLALNTDYRTANFNTYYNTMYSLLGHNGYVDSTNSKNFVNFAKKNKLVVEGYAFPDTSTIFSYQGTEFIRTKFKFRVINSSDYSQFNMDSFDPSEVSESPKWVRKGRWYEVQATVALFTNSTDVKWTLKLGNTENMFRKGYYTYKELK